MRIEVDGKATRFLPQQKVFVVPIPTTFRLVNDGPPCVYCGEQKQHSVVDRVVEEVQIANVSICNEGFVSYYDMNYNWWKEYEVFATAEEAQAEADRRNEAHKK